MMEGILRCFYTNSSENILNIYGRNHRKEITTGVAAPTAVVLL